MSNRTTDNEDKVAGSTALILNCRPAQIPAKSSSEQLEHERLYEQILQNAKKKGDFKHTIYSITTSYYFCNDTF